jgi:hypothetical protein
LRESTVLPTMSFGARKIYLNFTIRRCVVDASQT